MKFSKRFALTFIALIGLITSVKLSIIYMDANFMFVDANGNLSSDYSGDGCHLRAKEYIRWVEWIKAQTKELLGL